MSTQVREAGPATFEIRASTVMDVGAMALVQARANAAREGRYPLLDSQARLQSSLLMDRMLLTSAWAHVAMGADKMAGFVLGHSTAAEASVDTELRGEFLALLMTDPDHWGDGIGGALLDAAQATVQRKRRSHMVLWAGATNDRAQQLYERKGYVRAGLAFNDPLQGKLVQYRLEL